MTTSKRKRLTDLQKAKQLGKSVAEMKFPNSAEVRKATAIQSKVKWPNPNPCEHDKIDYKAMSFMARQQLKIIKQLTKQIAEMEDKFKLSQEGLAELTKVFSERIFESNKIIKDLHDRIFRRAN
jgi:hypothetical protein